MDPYFERAGTWPGFHSHFVSQFVRTLSPGLPDGYYADMQVTLFIHEPPANRRVLGFADDVVAIGEPLGRHDDRGTNGGVATATATAPSVRMTLGDAVELRKYYSVEIRADDGRVVTVVELLSPANKRGADRGVYEHKRAELIRAGVHFLQIDLLRGGPRLLPAEAAPHDYDALLVRAGGGRVADVWLWGLRDALPTLPVPLGAGEADVPLDLRAALDRVYDEAGYARKLYRGPPEVPLDEADTAWAAGLVREREAAGKPAG